LQIKTITVLLRSHKLEEKEPAQLRSMLPCSLPNGRKEPAQLMISSSSSGVVDVAAARDHIERMRKDIYDIGQEERNPSRGGYPAGCQLPLGTLRMPISLWSKSRVNSSLFSDKKSHSWEPMVIFFLFKTERGEQPLQRWGCVVPRVCPHRSCP